MRVATDPGRTVEPFGRITPVDPGIALMVLLPTVAMGVADVGLGIDGGVTPLAGFVLCEGDDALGTVDGLGGEGGSIVGSSSAGGCDCGLAECSTLLVVDDLGVDIPSGGDVGEGWLGVTVGIVLAGVVVVVIGSAMVVGVIG